jgi:hypothetical protein
VLAADADFQIRASLAAGLHRHLDKLADAFLIEHCEAVVLEDLGRL